GGGEERVGGARALACWGQIMVLDERSAALEGEMIGGVLQVMKSLAHSVIRLPVGSQEMQFAREIGSRVVCMRGGDSREVAPPAEFF
ncbi:amino acid ABC transporter ATP-binding protein, partial [Klebsiella pneumoniae]|nr:amino acid ABC transporter ATP-binding protein [Klebsiella pneumoniae]